eukprot:CAMPEP_0174969856 /NCGR_PEP_ID=MMETSP0004_2-20121128/9016_1 /TAXON_ID=420556 /ORGANISM="Ochromonas sp., Strain CCMP1393" /LENGTH=303 /DNA_ID=CAMNT_0016219435 /DNA_START=1711 /DNA_END=2625 /DNA_ORIENTATION=-
MEIRIYHELQDSRLCGQHCLNNLLQEDFFTPVHLAQIAQELDDQEKVIMSGSGDLDLSPGKSANVDESGNFSIQVLRLALQRFNNVDLIPWHEKSGAGDEDPLNQQGFVVNRSEHWFTIRNINNHWWNLNSTMERPELISEFYLSAFLHQLREDGYSVFIAKGNLPVHHDTTSPRRLLNGVNEGGRWYSEQELLNDDNAGKDKLQVPQQAFTGVAHRLGGGGNDANAESGPNINMQDFRVDGEGLDDDEDLMLAQAISASLADPTGSSINANMSSVNNSGETKKNAAADMRAKRLAALEKRGF